jgi:hypothetical protein
MMSESKLGSDWTRLGGALALALSMVSCQQQRPPLLSVFGSGADVTVYVAVSARAAQQDTGNVAAMVDTLESDLREVGRSVAIVAARLDERPPLPRIEVQVRSSASGDAQLRGAGQLSQLMSPVTGAALYGAGTGSMTADVYVVRRANEPTYLGRFSSSSFGAMSDTAVAAGERVGHQISAHLRASYP